MKGELPFRSVQGNGCNSLHPHAEIHMHYNYNTDTITTPTKPPPIIGTTFIYIYVYYYFRPLPASPSTSATTPPPTHLRAPSLTRSDAQCHYMFLDSKGFSKQIKSELVNIIEPDPIFWMYNGRCTYMVDAPTPIVVHA